MHPARWLGAFLLTCLQTLVREAAYRWLACANHNVVDIEAAKQAGVKVSNVRGYSTPAVVKQVFALLLEMTNQVALNDKSVKSGEWASSKHFCYWKQPIDELQGKTFGIYGFG